MSTPIFEKEPTPELEATCRTIINEWQSGQLPFKEAAQQMLALGEKALKQGHLANVARVEYLLGYMQAYRSKLRIAIEHFERARSLFLKIDNSVRVTRCDLNLGESHRQLGDFTKAQRLFHSAYESAARNGDLSTETIAIANEGQVLLSKNLLEDAKAALLEAYALTERWSEEERPQLAGLLCEIHYGLSVIYLAENEAEAAWYEAQKAYEAATLSQEPLSIGQANRTMGEVLTALETPPHIDNTDPDHYFQVALDAFESMDAEGELARTLHAQARSLAKRGRRIPAARKLQKATLMFAKLGMVDDAAKASESQALIF